MIERFKELVPSVTDYSYDKILRFAGPKEVTFKYPYLRVNEPERISFVVLDVDEKYQDFGLAPSFIVVNPENEHYHAFYVLKKPVIRGNAKAWWLMGKVATLYMGLLGSDRAMLNQRLMVHNPLHKKWQFVPLSEKEFTLLEMYEEAMGFVRAFGLDETVTESTFSTNSRNCLIFDALRKCNFDSLNDYLAKARKLNGIVASRLGKLPLNERELATIARSVWRYKRKNLMS